MEIGKTGMKGIQNNNFVTFLSLKYSKIVDNKYSRIGWLPTLQD